MGHVYVCPTLNTHTQVMDVSLRIAADEIAEEWISGLFRTTHGIPL